MPIKDMPRSFRRLGKIRLGEQVPVMENGEQKIGRTGKPVTRPAKLERFRLTSPDRELLDAAAEIYGGEVREWAGAPGDGDHWELYIEATYLDVTIPPQFPSDDGDVDSGSFQQWYELWSGGGCQRRCDGITEQNSGKACASLPDACPREHEARRAAAAKGDACKMTTRMMMLLPKLPDIGVWMIETHGWYAGVELGGFVEFLARRAPGQFVNAQAFPDPRTVTRKGKTHHFVVPAFKLPQATAGELMAAEPVRELGAGANVAGVVTDAERVRDFVIKVSDAGWDNDVRHAIVAYATKGRTRSTREVAVDEWPACEAVLRWLNDEKLRIVGEGDGTVLRKVEASGPPPDVTTAPAGNGAIPVQSRESEPLADEPEFDADPEPVENPADDWDRTELHARLDKLDDEHRELVKARWMEQGITPPNSPRLTKDDVDAARSLLLAVEKEAETAYKNRLVMARARMKEVGVTTDAARTLLVEGATNGKGDLKRLSAEDVAKIDAYCQQLADTEAAEAQAS